MNYKSWYNEKYHELCGGGVWLRGGEINTLSSAEFEKRPFKVLFARLSSYFDTRESFTHQYLYQLAASVPGVAPDIAYLPLKQDAEIFANSDIPWLMGTQSKGGPEEFDLIGLSNSIILEVLNVPTFLTRSGIPLKKSERLLRKEVPLVILGGANALFSSVLWGADPMIDGVFVGESGASVQRIIEICREAKLEGLSKKDTISRLLTVEGFFEPEKPVIAAKGRDITLESPPFTAGIVPFLEENAGSANLQISEGCPCFCNFCAEAWDRKPYRERPAGEVLKQALQMKAQMGLEEVNLYSFNFNLHSEIYQIVWDLLPLFRKIGLKSQRFDLLAHDRDMTELLKLTQKTSITCGMEGISERLRRYLHKNLDAADLSSSMELIFKNRMREIKIFLIATGLEEEKDFTEFASFLKNVKALRHNQLAQTRVIVSCTPLVRFPWTPLEFADAPSADTYCDVIEKIRNLVEERGFEFRESAEISEYLVSQLLVRTADEKLRAAMVDAVQASGFVYYRTMSQSFVTSFLAALNGQGLLEADLLKGASLEDSKSRPWAALETGVKRDFLWKKFTEANQFIETEYCLGRDWANASCLGCGACPDSEGINALVHSRQRKPYNMQKFSDRASECRSQPGSIRLLVDFSESTRGLPRPLLGAAVARALMKAFPDMVRGYRGYKGSFWAQEERDMWLWGLDAVSLNFEPTEVLEIEKHCKTADAFAKISAELGSYGTVKGFAPAVFLPSRVELRSSMDFRPDRYLQGKGLKYTMRRNSDGSSSYEMSRDSTKKNILSSISMIPGENGGSRVVLSPGSKFRAHEFMQNCFVTRSRNEWMRIECVSS